jgi:hypothetical protein
MNISLSFWALKFLGATPNITTQEQVANFMSDSLKSIHTFVLALALLTMLYAIVRNYSLFGQDMGLKFIAGLFIVLVLFYAFPKIADNLRTSLENFSDPVSEEIDHLHRTLLSTSTVQNHGNINSNIATKVIKSLAAENSGTNFLGALTYWGGTYLAKSLRDFLYLITLGAYNFALVLSPLFLSFLLIGELKNIGVNFLTASLALIMMPLCNLFGDLCYLWLVINTWQVLGLDTSSNSILSNTVNLIPVFPSIMAIIFGIMLAVIALFIYIFIPIIFVKLFRTGSATLPAGLVGMLIGKTIGAMIASNGASSKVAVPKDVATNDVTSTPSSQDKTPPNNNQPK